MDLDREIGSILGMRTRRPPKNEPILCAECGEKMSRKERRESVHCPKCLAAWYGEEAKK